MKLISELNDKTSLLNDKIKEVSILNIFFYILLTSFIAGFIFGGFEFIERHYASGYYLDTGAKIYGLIYASGWAALYGLIIGCFLSLACILPLFISYLIANKIGKNNNLFLIWLVPIFIISLIESFFVIHFYLNGVDSEFTTFFLLNTKISEFALDKLIIFIILIPCSFYALYIEQYRQKSFIKHFLISFIGTSLIVTGYLYYSKTIFSLLSFCDNFYKSILNLYSNNAFLVIASIILIIFIFISIYWYLFFLLLPRLWEYKLFRLIVGATLLFGFIISYLFTVNFITSQSFYIKALMDIHFITGTISLFYFILLTFYILNCSNITPIAIKQLNPKARWLILIGIIALSINTTLYFSPSSYRLKAFIDKSCIIQKHLTYNWVYPLFNKKKEEFFTYNTDNYCVEGKTTPESITLKERPNIFMISIDALRTDYSLYKKNAPNIYNFINNSNFFVNNYSHATHTPASLSSISISKYYAAPISNNKLSFANILYKNGYKTGLFIGTNLDQKKMVTLKAIINDKDYISPIAYGYKSINLTQKKYSNSDKDMLKTCQNFIESNKSSNNPLLIWFHIYNLHDTHINNVYRSFFSKDPFEKEYLQRLKNADKVFGDFINYLKKNNLYDKSIIVLFSDHGEEIKEHCSFYHTFTLYQEIIRVPLAIKFPGEIKSKKIEIPTSSLDLTPTLLNYMGVETDSIAFCGESLLPLLNKKSNKHKLPISSIYRSFYFFGNKGKNLPGSILVSKKNAKYCVRRFYKYSIVDNNNQWKLIYNGFPEYFELYNLKNDPEEKVNLADENTDIVKKLMDTFNKQIQ
ncbi:MAG: sulfatase-like hydrolase/transferase [Cyanobacteriota bacterium]